jgi:hypothetical protein
MKPSTVQKPLSDWASRHPASCGWDCPTTITASPIDSATDSAIFLLGWKQRVTASPAGFRLSLAPGVILPTGSNGRTNGVPAPQLDLAWLRPVDSRWSISGVQTFEYSSSDSRHFLETSTVLAVERSLGHRKDAYVEYQRSDSSLGSMQMLEAGVSYRNRPSCQFDILIGVGYGRRAAGFTLGIGFSFREDNIWKRRPKYDQ